MYHRLLPLSSHFPPLRLSCACNCLALEPPCVLQPSSRKECPVKHWLCRACNKCIEHHVSERTASLPAVRQLATYCSRYCAAHMGLLIISPRHKRSVPAAHVQACMAQVPARHMACAKPGELPCLGAATGPPQGLALRPAIPWFLAPVRRCYREVLGPRRPQKYPPYRCATRHQKPHGDKAATPQAALHPNAVPPPSTFAPRPSSTAAARIASLMSLGLCRGIWPLLHPWIACSAVRPLAARRSVSFT